MRLLAIFFACSIAGTTFADTKNDCIKALNEAKQAGLPISPADMHATQPSRQALELEKLIDKADKTMRKYQPSMGNAMKMDMDNIDRKQQGKPTIPYPQATPAQAAARTKEVLAIIDQIGQTTGPRRYDPKSTPLDAFPRAAIVKGLVNLQLDEVTSLAKKGDSNQVVKKLKNARRLVEIVRGNSTMVGVLAQQASEQKYYAALQKVAKDYPAVGKTFTKDLVAPFKKPTSERILQEEFLQTLSPFERSVKAKELLKVGNWTFNGDKDSLTMLCALAKSWTIAFKAMKTAKTGKELEDRYKAIAPKLGVYKVKGQEDFELGPSWADKASVLDRAETKRLETIKVLGLG